MTQNSGGIALIVGALILAGAIVGSAALLKGSIDEGNETLIEVRTALASLDKTVKDGALAAARPAPAPVARRGPDPDKRHDVNISGAPVLGNDDAKITVVEFSDFQCPFCARVDPTLKKIQETYGPDQVRIVYKHLPLSIHPGAPGAAAAAEAAHRQGKFWEMHDLIFANQRELNEAKYVEYAQQLGLDVDQFKKDSASAEVKKRVDEDAQEAAALGVTGTPAFFINGKFLSGAQPYQAFKAAIDQEMQQEGTG
jgi:protein-disulfide isomerase